MAITSAQLAQRYPYLYHVAWHRSWPSIQKNGLLSTAALLDLFEIPDPRRTELLIHQRRKPELISHPLHGSATLRDQKPLSEKNLRRCLTDCEPATWYRTINERVFFWLDRNRLLKFMSAKEYVGKPHTVIQVESATLVTAYTSDIQLAHMNTGNTLPYPHPRGLSTFRTLEDYAYEERQRLNDYSAVVELTVFRGVLAHQHAIKVEHALVEDGKYRSIEIILEKSARTQR